MAPDQSGQGRLVVRGAVKRYGPREVLSNVDITVRPGEVHGLIGPNGSGKSTLLKCIMGAETLTEGDVLFEGERINSLSPPARNRRGMAIKFQHAEVVPNLTVRQNIRLAINPRRTVSSWLLRGDQFLAREDELLAAFGIEQKDDWLALNLSHGERQWLELAMALANDPGLLLLDEPTAGMSVAERSQTEEALRAVLHGGRSIVLVDHDLDFVKRFSDSITVLNNGVVVRSASTAEVASDPEVRRIYLGESHR